MRSTTLIGSAWDVGASPERVNPAHLKEWVQGSAVAPELAAANLQSLQGSAVLEALLGDRLEQLGGHAKQFTTSTVRRLVAPLEPVAEAGGWWCSGLDPLADWAPMGWGCFKPDRPRTEQRDGRTRQRKYEHPLGAGARLFWLRVPATMAKRVANRFRLPLPAEVAADRDGSAGAFWRWWAHTPQLPLVMAEGSKKAGALLSIGLPAVAAPGIWNPAPRNPDTNRPVLLPELLEVPLQGRPCWVLFDHSDSHQGRADVRKASRRIGRLLAKQGATVLVGAGPGPHKGLDDHLAGGGSWEQLDACLQPLTPEPVLPWLRPADRIAPAGQWLADACPIPAPAEARLVVSDAPMGSGKTEAIAAALAPLQAAGVRVVLIAHRRSLGASQAERLGLPWADEAAPGSDLRQTGIALCVDSLCPTSALRFRASDWAGAVVVMDEVAQVLLHALMATGTAVADRRPQVLTELAALLRDAAQVIATDAQLSTPVLEALEAITGTRALLISSKHKPAAGRSLTSHPTRDSWRLALVEHLQQRRPVWISTTAQKAGSPNSAQNLAALATQHWFGCRTLVVDSQTVADPEHPASRLASDPNGIAAQFDAVVASPAVAAGLSITMASHFGAVFVIAGGTTDPAAVAQAAARVRDGVPRHLHAPERSPGSALRIGSGSPDPTDLIRHLQQHEAAAVTQLLTAGWNHTTATTGPWLPLWAQLAGIQNQQRLAYRATVLGLLQREGYRVEEALVLTAHQQGAAGKVATQLAGITTAAQTAEDLAIQQAPLLSDEQASKLQQRQRLRPAERAQLQRWRIAKAWGLGDAAPTTMVLEATRDGLDRRLRFGWILQSSRARELVARADLATGQRLTATGSSWAPDLCRELIGPRLAAAEALGLPRWLQRTDWITAVDPALLELQALATSHSSSVAQVLGITPGQRATTTLRQLLALAGYRLEAKRARRGEGRHRSAGYRYRVIPLPLPAGVESAALTAAWEAELHQQAAGVCTKTRHLIEAGTGTHPGQTAPQSARSGG